MGHASLLMRMDEQRGSTPHYIRMESETQLAAAARAGRSISTHSSPPRLQTRTPGDSIAAAMVRTAHWNVVHL